MIVCSECGTRNPPGTQFCGECGSFLEWDGDSSAATAAPVVAARGGGTTTATPADPVSPTVPVTADAKPGNPVTTADATTEAAPVTAPEPATPAVTPTPTPTLTPATGGGSAAAAESVTPRLVQPGERQFRYQQTGGDEPDTFSPGDVKCRNCGVGNVATRRFCRSCGHLLAAPVEAERRSWWRRLLDRLGRRGRYEAGTRRKVRNRRAWLRPFAALVVVAAAVLSLMTVLPTRTYLNRAITTVRDRLAGDPAPVTPVAIRASSSASGTKPANISDGVTNRYWAPAKGPVGQWIEVDFERPVRLLVLSVTPGISTEKDKFLTQGRPHELTVEVTNEDGRTTTLPVVVQDKPGGQNFDVKVSDAVRVRVTIASGYEVKPPRKCAFGEMEFYIRG